MSIQQKLAHLKFLSFTGKLSGVKQSSKQLIFELFLLNGELVGARAKNLAPKEVLLRLDKLSEQALNGLKLVEEPENESQLVRNIQDDFINKRVIISPKFFDSYLETNNIEYVVLLNILKFGRLEDAWRFSGLAKVEFQEAIKNLFRRNILQ